MRLFVTRTFVPKGNVLWAAVSFLQSKVVPLAVLLPWARAPYHAQRPAPPEPASLLPTSLARSGVEGLAEAAERVRPRDAELLALPDSLKEK